MPLTTGDRPISRGGAVTWSDHVIRSHGLTCCIASGRERVRPPWSWLDAFPPVEFHLLMIPVEPLTTPCFLVSWGIYPVSDLNFPDCSLRIELKQWRWLGCHLVSTMFVGFSFHPVSVMTFFCFFFWFCFLYFLPFFCLRLICYVEYYNMIMNVFNWASEQHQCGGWSFQETWRCFSKSWGRIPNDSLEIRWIFSRFLSEIPSGGCALLFQFI